MSEEQEDTTNLLSAERCPLCGTIMTAERGGPVRFANPGRTILLPGEDGLTIDSAQSVLRFRCENGHVFWRIDADDAADGCV